MDVLQLLCPYLITTRNYCAIDKNNVHNSMCSSGDRFKEKEREIVL